MPFINGRYYMNPVYGRAVELARDTETARDDSQSEGQDSQWVTIGGRHVLIQPMQARDPQHKNSEKRSTIAKTARKYSGSSEWAFAKRKGNFAPDTNKCNQYVYDVTKEAGAEAAFAGSDGKSRPPLAAEWADPNTKIANRTVLGKNEKPEPGDVAAYKLHGGTSFSGHSGIVTSVDSNGLVHAMAAHDQVVGPDEKFNPGVGAATITYRRFRGGSR
jgi:hypothetical protein